MSNFYWQPAVALFISLLFAWYSWQVNCLRQAFDRRFPNSYPSERQEEKYLDFFARSLSDLPFFLAVRVLKSTLQKYGVVLFKDKALHFKKKHLDIRQNRKTLRKNKVIL